MDPYHTDRDVTLYHGNALTVLAEMPDQSVQTTVTSPPYLGLRDYGVPPADWPAVEYSPMRSLPPVQVPAMTCCLGNEGDPFAYVGHLLLVLRQVARVLRRDGTVWLNIGDSYSSKANGGATFDRHRGSGHRPGVIAPQVNTTDHARFKSLLGVPWRLAFALQADGWTVRNEIIWNKPNAMPESVTDRLSNRYERVFLLTRANRYWFNLDPIREALAYPELADGSQVFGGVNKGSSGGIDSAARRRGGNTYGYRPDPTVYPGRQNGQPLKAATGRRHGAPAGRPETTPPGMNPQTNFGPIGHRNGRSDPRGRNPGDVWTLPTTPFAGAHYAVMSHEVARRCILAGSPEGGLVLDPFVGACTSMMVARQTGRRGIGVDLSTDSLDIGIPRIGEPILDFDIPVTATITDFDVEQMPLLSFDN